MTIALYPHKSGLGLMEPVAQIMQNVAIFWAGNWQYRVVSYLEPIPPFQFLDIGAVAASATSVKTAAPNLDAFNEEFLQIRWWPLDNAQIRLWLPAANQRYALRNISSIVDPNIVNRDPCLHLTEFFVWQDNDPSFEAVNGMDYALAQCRLIGMGFRFVTKAMEAVTKLNVESGKLPCTYVVATSGKAG